MISEEDLARFHVIGVETYANSALEDEYCQGMEWLKKVPLDKRHTIMGVLQALAETSYHCGMNGYTLKMGAPPGKMRHYLNWYSEVTNNE